MEARSRATRTVRYCTWFRHMPAITTRKGLGDDHHALHLKTSGYVQVSRTPASQKHPRAPTTGVREAPRHEIAGRKGLCFAAAIYGDLRSASVCFREAGTTDARQFDGLTGRGERAPSALGSGLVWRRRSQDVGAASSSERRRRWLKVSGKNGKNGRRCVAVDNAMSIMTYRS